MKSILHKEPTYAELISVIEKDSTKISLPNRRATQQWASPYNVMDTGESKLDEANWDWQTQGIYVPPQSRAFDGPGKCNGQPPLKTSATRSEEVGLRRALGLAMARRNTGCSSINNPLPGRVNEEPQSPSTRLPPCSIRTWPVAWRRPCQWTPILTKIWPRRA